MTTPQYRGYLPGTIVEIKGMRILISKEIGIIIASKDRTGNYLVYNGNTNSLSFSAKKNGMDITVETP